MILNIWKNEKCSKPPTSKVLLEASHDSQKITIPMVGIIPLMEPCKSSFLQCEAPKIAKWVYKSNNYGLW